MYDVLDLDLIVLLWVPSGPFVLGSFVTVDYIFGALLISCTLVLNAELI